MPSPSSRPRRGRRAWPAGAQDGARIRRLREAADFAIYTPGSQAGLPVSILKSFAAPPPAVREDAEALGERINTTVTSLLGLVGVEADPVKSREHILVSTILREAWTAGRDLDLAALIQQIQTPPVKRVGVLDVEAFFSAKDRFALAMTLNNLLAAPGFAAWMEGEPLDVQTLLFTLEGKPRVSIFSIAHLGDAERMFFVSLLLNQTVGWMRNQSGTTSLRALVYMDEIFGYFPPVANPPVQAAAAHPAEAGARLRGRRGARDPEPRGPRLQGPVQRRDLVHRPPADRARQGARARRPGGGGGRLGGALRSRQDGRDHRGAGQPHLSHEQRPRRRPGGVRDALGHVLSPRAAHPRPDQDTDGRPARRHGARRFGTAGGAGPDRRARTGVGSAAARCRFRRRDSRGRRAAGAAAGRPAAFPPARGAAAGLVYQPMLLGLAAGPLRRRQARCGRHPGCRRPGAGLRWAGAGGLGRRARGGGDGGRPRDRARRRRRVRGPARARGEEEELRGLEP